MLVEFSVENYKSFRDRTTFSMIAANLTSAEKRLDEDNTIVVSDSLRLLTSAAIYGKNASGKSNLGLALEFVRDFVLHSADNKQDAVKILADPFRLSTRTRNEPSFFEIVFLMNSRQYRYGFEADREHIVAEWLYHAPSGREYALFERDEQEISVKSGFKEGRGLEVRTRKDALFLSVAEQWNGQLARDLVDWFSTLNIASGLQDKDFGVFTHDCLSEGRYNDEINHFIRSADVEIQSLLAPTLFDMEKLQAEVSETQKQRGFSVADHDILTRHPVYDNDGMVVEHELFNLNREESQGTRKMIAMAGPILSVLQHGAILFVDEMDARLHTEITRAIVGLFNSKKTNPKGAQLIFVTHDTNLLDNTLLRRDQIWFAEKDVYEVTHLTALSEFNERNTANFEQRYLRGLYGGVPSLDNITFTPEAVHG